MFYFNSLFNFAIYYGGLLILAIGAALWIDARISAGRNKRIATVGQFALGLVVIGAFAQERRHFRSAPPNREQQRLFAASIEEALRIDPAQPKFINFESSAGGEAVGLALYLDRRDCHWMVREDWPLYFGREKVIAVGRTDQPMPTSSSSFWRVLLHNTALSQADNRFKALPLTKNIDLVIQPPVTNAAPTEN